MSKASAEQAVKNQGKLLCLGILALFFLSGITGLIYEIIWERQLVIVFGNTRLSTSTVLSAFMAGLAAGSYVFGKYADRKPDKLLKIYALLQAGIGCSAIIVPFLMKLATPLYVELYNIFENNILAINLMRFAVSFCLISVPTFLMGGTLPVLSKFFSKFFSSLGRNTALLYGVNTAGALIGCILAGLVLVPNFGITKTTFIAVAINFTISAVAWSIKSKNDKQILQENLESINKRGNIFSNAEFSLSTRTAACAGIFFSGLCALVYQVVFARMLNVFLGNTMFSFTITLSISLGGIALGGLIFSGFLTRFSRQVPLFFGIEAGIGIFAYLAQYALHPMLHKPTSSIWINLVPMFVPAVLMGAALPCAVQICRQGKGLEGISVGSVYAFNTVGAMLGPFVAGFMLIPRFGTQTSLLAAALLNLLAGTIVLLSSRPSRVRLISGSLAYISAVILAFIFIPSGFFQKLYSRTPPGVNLRFHKEGVAAHVLVYDFYREGYKDFYLNRTEEASTRLLHIQLFRMLSALPVVIHKNPDEAQMIAFGAGISAGAAANLVNKLDCVELNPDVYEVAEIFKRENLNVINNPAFNLIINDGRNQLLLTKKKYSLIISDATNPIAHDAWTLYTKEFYELVKKRLETDGVFCQWVPVVLPGDAIKIILNTFKSVFPHTSFWSIYGSSQALMLATPEKLNIDYADLEKRLPSILEASALTECGVDNIDKFLSFFLIGEKNLERLLQGFNKINTDDLPYTQFMVNIDEEGRRAAIDLFRHQESIAEYTTNTHSNEESMKSLRRYFSLSRMLNLGFTFVNEMEFEIAYALASQAGFANDESVKSVLGFDSLQKKYYQEWIENNQPDAIVHFNLGYIYWREKEYATAKKEVMLSLALDNSFTAAHLLLAYIHIHQGNLKEAAKKIMYLKKLDLTQDISYKTDVLWNIVSIMHKLETSPKNLKLNLVLANELARIGWIQRAFETIIDYSEKNPSATAPLFALADFFESIDMSGKALEIYRNLAPRIPNNPKLATKINLLSEIENNNEKWKRWVLSKIPNLPSENIKVTAP